MFRTFLNSQKWLSVLHYRANTSGVEHCGGQCVPQPPCTSSGIIFADPTPDETCNDLKYLAGDVFSRAMWNTVVARVFHNLPWKQAANTTKPNCIRGRTNGLLATAAHHGDCGTRWWPQCSTTPVGLRHKQNKTYVFNCWYGRVAGGGGVARRLWNTVVATVFHNTRGSTPRTQ